MRTQIHAPIWHEQRWSLRSLMARHGAVPALRDFGAMRESSAASTRVQSVISVIQAIRRQLLLCAQWS